MKLERIIDVEPKEEKTVTILKDNEKAVLVPANAIESSKEELDEILKEKGSDVKEVQKQGVRELALQDLKYEKEPATKEQEQVNDSLATWKQQGKVISNELLFGANSFAEGFLSMYGIELNNAVEKYQERIYGLEQTDLTTGLRSFNVVRLMNDHYKKIGNPFSSKEAMMKTLHAFKDFKELSKEQNKEQNIAQEKDLVHEQEAKQEQELVKSREIEREIPNNKY